MTKSLCKTACSSERGKVRLPLLRHVGDAERLVLLSVLIFLSVAFTDKKEGLHWFLLPPPPLPLPGTTTTLGQRLMDLKADYDSGRISEQEYNQRRQRLLQGG